MSGKWGIGLGKRISVGLVAIIVAIVALIPILNVMAAGPTYTITYVNSSTSYTKSYPAGTVTLDSLPSGAIAWTNDSDSTAPNGKMAYVDYSHTNTENGASVQVNIPITLNLTSNITLNANYGSYATGQGPRMVQYHLELKYMDMTTNQMMQYEQHYNSINAPAGYYIQLPPSNYFGNSLYAIVDSSSTLSDTGQSVSSWVNDGSYTGTTTEPQSNIFAPNALVYVDPNNYNMIYDAMVTPPAPVTPPPVAANDTVTFRISQANIPPASLVHNVAGIGFNLHGGAFWSAWPEQKSPSDWHLGTPPNDFYMAHYEGQAQIVISGLTDSTDWGNIFPTVNLGSLGPGEVLPMASPQVGYTFYWDMDGVRIPTVLNPPGSAGAGEDASLSTYFNDPNSAVKSGVPIGGSHVFTLHYVPITATVQLYVDGHVDSVVYDANSHSVSGYDVYDCSGVANIDQDNLSGSGCTLQGTSSNGGPVTLPNGDVLNFVNTSGNSNITATGTDVGTYPMVLTASDFSVNNSVTGDLYNLTMSNGGLTITKKDLPIIVTPPIDPNQPGDQTGTVTPQNPGDLGPGHEIITPGTGITDNGDGTSTTDGNTNINVTIDPDGNIIITDNGTGLQIPCDVTKPNCGVIWIGDTSNNDPNTGKPTDVTNNYNPSNVFPNRTNPGNNNPDAPNSGASVFETRSERGNAIALALVGVTTILTISVLIAKRVAKY